MKKCYTDPDISQRALEYLRRIYQGENKPFTAFFPQFERELMENDGVVWPDYFKILYLERALNAEIVGYLITMNRTAKTTLIL